MAPDLVVDATTNHGITNTIAVNAATGDAVVANNTFGGNATSGDAQALANVANVSNSSLSLTGWFGVLFINITGDWFGSFQVNTPFGNPSPISTPTPVGSTPSPGPVQFVPKEPKPRQTTTQNTGYTIIDSRNLSSDEPVLLASTHKPAVEGSESEVRGAMSTEETADANEEATDEPQDMRLWITLGALVLTGVSVVGLRRII